MENRKPMVNTIRVEVRPMPSNYGLGVEELRREYSKIVGIYEAAIREIDARLQTLDSEFSMKHQHNPIHHLESRVKTLGSIVRKLREAGSPVSIDIAKKTLHDIAGVRVVCRYVDDIYKIADLLLQQDDISLILKKDYIKKPKPNGYRSLHIVVDVPIYMSQGKLFIPVEIQIRTVAMDFWATLEHGIRYKATDEVPQRIVDELRSCADVITENALFTDLSAQVPERVRVYSILRLIPGASIGYHVHEGETELFYFMEGNGRVQDDDQFFDIAAGDSMATFSGHGHGVENTGDTDLVLLACIVKD